MLGTVSILHTKCYGSQKLELELGQGLLKKKPLYNDIDVMPVC